MSILGKFVKQPAEVESYSIDYTDDLIGTDGITFADATVSPPGLALMSVLIVGNRIKVLTAEGGAVGTKHKVTVTAMTDDGRVLQDEFIVTIKDY